MEINFGLFILNALLGVGMYFMKQAHDATKEQLNRCVDDIANIKDTYFKKEDFKEFKDELWTRIDKLENSFDRRLQELRK